MPWISTEIRGLGFRAGVVLFMGKKLLLVEDRGIWYKPFEIGGFCRKAWRCLHRNAVCHGVLTCRAIGIADNVVLAADSTPRPGRTAMEHQPGMTPGVRTEPGWRFLDDDDC